MKSIFGEKGTDEALPPDVEMVVFGGIFSFSGLKVVILIPRISNHKPSEVQPIYFKKIFSKKEEFSNKKSIDLKNDILERFPDLTAEVT